MKVRPGVPSKFNENRDDNIANITIVNDKKMNGD